MTRKPPIQHLCFTAVAIALFLVGCNSKEYDRMTDEVRQLRTEMAALATQKSILYQEKSEADRLISRFSQFQREESQHLIELDDIEKYQRELEAAVNYIDSQLSIWLPATYQSLEGLPLGSVRLPDGKILSDAIVVRLDSLQVELKHSTGTATAPLAELDEPVRKKLLHKDTVILNFELDE